MNAKEVLAQILSLPYEEREDLLRQLKDVLQDKFQSGKYTGASVDEVRGIIKPEQELPPDFDWKKLKEEYLVEKYL